MKTLAITILISKPVIVWSVIGLFLIAAFVLRIVDDFSTMKDIDKALAARKSMRAVKSEQHEQQESQKVA